MKGQRKNRTKKKQEELFMEEAINLSRVHMRKGHGGPFGAVIVYKGKIISRGWNCVTSKNDPTAHAEVSAIRKACRKLKTFDLSGAEIYSSCEPCPMCLAAIYWARITKIFFANTRQDAAKIDFDDDFLYKEISKKRNLRKIGMIQICRASSMEVFAEWIKNENRVRY